MNRTLLIILITIILIPITAQAKTLAIQTDSDWFPYTYEEENESLGIHVDIVKEALTALKYTFTFTPFPWKRCLANLEFGNVEVILSASYKDKRALYAHYPTDAATAKKSNWRIDQVEYVLITRKGEPYEFDGDFSKIPQPVNVALGAAIGDFLQEKGIEVKENIKNSGNINMLLAHRAASIAMNPLLAENFNKIGKFKGKLKIHSLPLRSKSYFLIFSKMGKLSAKERNTIWKAITKVRDNKPLMLRILKKYNK